MEFDRAVVEKNLKDYTELMNNLKQMKLNYAFLYNINSLEEYEEQIQECDAEISNLKLQIEQLELENIDSVEKLKEIKTRYEMLVKKMHSNPSALLQDSKQEDTIAWLFNLSNIPKNDNGKLVNVVDENYRKVQKAYKLCEDNILSQIPLWVANCYEYEDYAEKEVIMKTADKGKKYMQDEEFLFNSFFWAECLKKIVAYLIKI